MSIKIWCDGSVTKNPGGKAAIGVLVNDHGRIIEFSESVGSPPFTSCNLAEFEAIVKGLEWVVESGNLRQEVIVHSDSEFCVNFIKYSWPIKTNGPYVIGALKVRKLIPLFCNLKFVWIRREKNERADFLSKQPHGVKVNRKNKKPKDIIEMDRRFLETIK